MVETFQNLTDADAAKAEALVMDQLADKTYMQVMRLAEQAALTVSGLAERRREEAQKRDARVSFFREQAGTAALSGRDLPPDEALAAMESVNARAEEYVESGAFGDTPMDVLRACAFLDLINGLPADGRIAAAERPDDSTDSCDDAEASPSPGDGHDDKPDDDDGSLPDDDGDGGPGHGGPGPRPGPGPTGQPRLRRPADLIVPLTTLLGLAQRPGELHRFGLLDPALARELAAAAAASPGTEVCVTVTSGEGTPSAMGAPARRGGHPRPAAPRL